MVRKFSWEYRRANLAEFPFVCNICGPEERRFRKEKDQQKHDEMTKRHDPNFVPHTMAIGSGSIDFIRNERDLEVFIRDHVETDDAYRSVCKGVIRNVGDILKNNIKGKYRPDEVLKVRICNHNQIKRCQLHFLDTPEATYWIDCKGNCYKREVRCRSCFFVVVKNRISIY